jgi:hypothetical protein
LFSKALKRKTGIPILQDARKVFCSLFPVP